MITAAATIVGLATMFTGQFEIKPSATGTSSRLYVHLPVGVDLTHNYYYFRMLDVWERPATPSDQHLYSRLFTSGEQAPGSGKVDTFTSPVPKRPLAGSAYLYSACRRARPYSL